MNIDTIYDGKILVKFIYSPLNEMLCALHVLCNSKHHLHRKEWADSVYEKIDNKLKNSILEFGEITDDYMIPMDFNMYFKECDDLNILSSIEYLENVNLYNIRKIFRKYNISINSGQYKRFLSFLKQFYIEVYMKEEKYIEPVIIRTLKKKADYISMLEAVVSKALKLLFESKIVSKQRNGNYIIYNLNKRELDYLEYKIYEYILR